MDGILVQADGKMNQLVGDKNFLDTLVGRVLNGQFVPLQGTSSGNLLGEFYRHIPLGLKDTRFGYNLNNMSLIRGKLH